MDMIKTQVRMRSEYFIWGTTQYFIFNDDITHTGPGSLYNWATVINDELAEAASEAMIMTEAFFGDEDDESPH